jgi:hypothetical protein
MELLDLRALIVTEVERREHRTAEPARSAATWSAAASPLHAARTASCLPAKPRPATRLIRRERATFAFAMSIDDGGAGNDGQARGRRQYDVLRHDSLLMDEAFRRAER